MCPILNFGKIYFSSHKILKKQFRKNPTKFKFSITVTFNSIKQARDYEVKRNKKIINDKGWLNIQAWPAIMNKQAPNLGIPMSKETKIKISSAKKGKKLNIPLETRKRLSEMRKGHTWNKGRKRSKKFKEKLRLANIGKKLTKSHKKKIRKSNKGKKISSKQKKQISKKLKSLKLIPWNKGIPMSKKAKKKLSASLKKKNKKLTLAQRKAKFGHPGWKHTDEAKKKISLAGLNRRKS